MIYRISNRPVRYIFIWNVDRRRVQSAKCEIRWLDVLSLPAGWIVHASPVFEKYFSVFRKHRPSFMLYSFGGLPLLQRRWYVRFVIISYPRVIAYPNARIVGIVQLFDVYVASIVSLTRFFHFFSLFFAGKFISTLLLSLSAMLHIGLPHLNVLSKMDLLRKFESKLSFTLDYYTDVLDLSYLIECLDQDAITSKWVPHAFSRIYVLHTRTHVPCTMYQLTTRAYWFNTRDTEHACRNLARGSQLHR